MEIAREKLDAETYGAIYARAVVLDRKQQAVPLAPAIDKPVVAERLEAHLNGVEAPQEVSHVQERLQQRMDIEVTTNDLGDLLRVAMKGGPEVQIVGQKMDLVQECIVNWRGKHFVVMFSKSRGKLITAYPHHKRKTGHKMRAGRPRDWRAREIG